MSTQEEAAVATGSVERPPAAGIVLATVAVLYLAALLWSARATITGGADAESEVTSAAYALPGTISAALVAGAALALAVLALLARRRTPGATTRFAVATGAGLVLGLLGALSIITINTEGWVYAVLGGTVAAAATVGGALAGVRAPRVVSAGCWAALAVFAAGFVLSLSAVQNPLRDLLGAGDTRASLSSAATTYSYLQAALGGLAAGLVAYAVLRRGTGVRWPSYTVAGAVPGAVLVLAELLTRTAGARVVDLAGRVSPLEQTVQQMLSGSRLNGGLVVLFVGAITATIAVGRKLGPADEPAT
jgi:iron complex transport system permease protein